MWKNMSCNFCCIIIFSSGYKSYYFCKKDKILLMIVNYVFKFIMLLLEVFEDSNMKWVM